MYPTILQRLAFTIFVVGLLAALALSPSAVTLELERHHATGRGRRLLDS